MVKILVSFRTHHVAVTADVQKAFFYKYASKKRTGILYDYCDSRNLQNVEAKWQPSKSSG